VFSIFSGVNDHPKSGQIRQLKTSQRLFSRLCLVLLFFAGKCRVCVFESVAAAFKGDEYDVVHDPVGHSWSDDVVAENQHQNRKLFLGQVRRQLKRGIPVFCGDSDLGHLGV